MLVVERDGGYAGLSDVVVDLRVDDHAEPIAELRRLHAIAPAPLREDAPRRLAAARRGAARGLVDRLGRLGYDGGLEQALAAWAATENLEERVDGIERIDPVVLAELRAR